MLQSGSSVTLVILRGWNELVCVAVSGEVRLDRLANELGHRTPCLELEIVESLDLLGPESWLIHVTNLLFCEIKKEHFSGWTMLHEA